MTSTLVPLRHDITAAHNWIADRLTILDKKRLTPEDLQGDFKARASDIENIIDESRSHLKKYQLNQDPVLKLNVNKLIKSWALLCPYFDANRVPVEPLDLSFADNDSVSSHSSEASYTARFEPKEPDGARKYIPHLTPLYRAVIRAKVKHHKRSGGSPDPSISSNSSFSGSPLASPSRASNRDTIPTPTTTGTRRNVPVTLDLSDSEPELEEFPWVYVSDDELELPDLPESDGEATREPSTKEVRTPDNTGMSNNSNTSTNDNVTTKPKKRRPTRHSRLPIVESTSNSSIDSDSGIFHEAKPRNFPLASSSVVDSGDESADVADAAFNDEQQRPHDQHEFKSSTENLKRAVVLESSSSDEHIDNAPFAKYGNKNHAKDSNVEPDKKHSILNLQPIEDFVPLLSASNFFESMTKAAVADCKYPKNASADIAVQVFHIQLGEIYTDLISKEPCWTPPQVLANHEFVNNNFENHASISEQPTYIGSDMPEVLGDNSSNLVDSASSHDVLPRPPDQSNNVISTEKSDDHIDSVEKSMDDREPTTTKQAEAVESITVEVAESHKQKKNIENIEIPLDMEEPWLPEQIDFDTDTESLQATPTADDFSLSDNSSPEFDKTSDFFPTDASQQSEETVEVYEETVEVYEETVVSSEIETVLKEVDQSSDQHSTKSNSDLTPFTTLSTNTQAVNKNLPKQVLTNDQSVQVSGVKGNETSMSWWLKALLIGLLLGVFGYFLFLCLVPEDCDNSCYHCGMLGMRKKYSGLPPH